MAGAPLGNTNGAKQHRAVTDMLRLVVAQDKAKLRKGCEAILDEAEKGNLYAMSFIADRLEGKPAQAVNLGNADGTNFELMTPWLKQTIQSRNSSE